ncbi:MAG: STAS domain-containing protein [Chloroflexi bacterium]|nr:STAS domain-containing protein [Chloroflexota bacterium]
MAVPIVQVGRSLIVTVPEALHDTAAVNLQGDILAAIKKTNASGVLIDVTALDVVDSFMGRLLVDTAAMARLLGARTALVGLQPEVAMTIVDLGLELPGLYTALDLEGGLQLLQHLDTERG